MSTAAVQKALDPRHPQEVRYRTWSPPQSSIAVEYSDELLREVRLTSLLGDASGVLYGTRHGYWIRVVAARRMLSNGGFEADPRLAGLEPIGVFFARTRGQIFLTESDLAQFAQSEGAVALVVAGTKAGFFLYEADGSIETIKSQGEFRVLGAGALTQLPPPTAEPAAFAKPPRHAADPPRASAWIWLFPLAILSIAGLLTTQSYWLPRPAISLTAHDHDGQLRIRWNRAAAAATPMGVTLEIADGDGHISMPISPEFASATYVRRTSDVQIHLTAAGHTETVRFFGAELPLSAIGDARLQVNQLEVQAQALDATLERGTRQIRRLETAIYSLMHASR